MLRILSFSILISFFLLSCQNISGWEEDNKETLRTVVQTGHRFIIQEIYFSYEDRMFLSGSNNVYKLWDIKSKRLVSTWDKQPDDISIIGFNKNDNIIAYDDHKYEYILSPIDGSTITKTPLTIKRLDQISDKIIKAQQISDDTDKNIWTSSTGRYQVTSPKFPGGNWIRNTDSRITLKDLNNNSETILHENAQWMWDMALSGNGRYLVTIEEREEGLREVCFYDLINAALDKKISWLPDELQNPPDDPDEDAAYQDCAINYDGSKIVAHTQRGATYVWDTKSWKLIYYFLPGVKMVEDYPGMDMTGNLIAMKNSENNHSVEVINVKTGNVIKQFNLPFSGDDRKTSFSPDGNFLASVSNNRVRKIFNEYTDPSKDTSHERIIVIWDYNTGKELQIIKDHGEYTGPFGFSSDSKYILCGLDVYQVENGKLSKSISEMSFKEIEEITCEFGPFWMHNSELSINPYSSHFISLDGKTGNLEIRNSRDFSPVCELYSFSNAALMVTPDGYFSGTGKYNEHVNFVRGTTVYPFEELFKKYYNPDSIRTQLHMNEKQKVNR